MTQYDKDTEKFIELLKETIGISKIKTKKYLKENSINSIFEHPESFTEKIKEQEQLKNLKKLSGIYKNLSQSKSIYVINSPYEAISYFRNILNQEKSKEYFYCAYLNTKNEVIECKEMFAGTINQSSVHPRELVKDALKYDAANIILSHNHPSGNPKPSLADHRVTKQISLSMNTIGINVIDHIIIGSNDKYFSYKEEKPYLLETKEINDLLSIKTPSARSKKREFSL